MKIDIDLEALRLREETEFSERKIEDFQKEPVWVEIESIIKERIGEVLVDLSSATIEQIPKLQGEINGLKFVLILPELMKPNNEFTGDNLNSEEQDERKDS